MNDLVVTLVAENAGVTKALARRVLKSFVVVIPEMVGKYGKVRIAGLGIFYKRVLPRRKSRNPHTAKDILVGPTASVRYRPARSVRELARTWVGGSGYKDRPKKKSQTRT